VSAGARCPSCGKPLDPAVTAFKPFCSERCKMADLGGWFAERYSVPAETSEDAEAPPEPPPRQ
jgi:endogenous inhibitor of DNA gyrase (YacG/DUF329 family)